MDHLIAGFGAKIKFLGVTVGLGGGLCLNLPGF